VLVFDVLYNRNLCRLPEIRTAVAKKLAAAAAKRAWEGAGSSGTQLTPGIWMFRLLAVLAQVGHQGVERGGISGRRVIVA